MLIQWIKSFFRLEEPESVIDILDDDFSFGLPEGIRVDALPRMQKTKSRAWPERKEKTFPEGKARGYHREYIFNEPEGHKPLAPKSALLNPRHLTRRENEAVALLEMLEGVKLKPYLGKKVKELKKGSRRVVFDDKGRMKELPKPKLKA